MPSLKWLVIFNSNGPGNYLIFDEGEEVRLETQLSLANRIPLSRLPLLDYILLSGDADRIFVVDRTPHPIPGSHRQPRVLHLSEAFADAARDGHRQRLDVLEEYNHISAIYASREVEDDRLMEGIY